MLGGHRRRPGTHCLHTGQPHGSMGTMGARERPLVVPGSGPRGLTCHECCWISPTTEVCKTRSRLTGCVKTGGSQVQPHVVTRTWATLPLRDSMVPAAHHLHEKEWHGCDRRPGRHVRGACRRCRPREAAGGAHLCTPDRQRPRPGVPWVMSPQESEAEGWTDSGVAGVGGRTNTDRAVPCAVLTPARQRPGVEGTPPVTSRVTTHRMGAE